jgi:cyclohexyl-isocyanide hydratase
MGDPITIVFPIYPGVTHLDFTGPHQVFARLPDATTEYVLTIASPSGGGRGSSVGAGT